jgi:iron complex transport system substrate-binding protein
VASAYNFPPAARKVPGVGDAFHMDIEKIAALHPDLVLAWRGSTPKRAEERLRKLGFTVATLGAERLRQIAGDLLIIGRATGRERAARAKAKAYLSGLAKLRQTYAQRTPISVFYEISAEPLYTVSGKQSISQIISLCGGRNIFADLGPLAPAVSLEAVLVRDPQAIITAGQGSAAKERLDRWRRWPTLAAVKAGNLFQVKPGDIARATPRILKGGRKICEDLDRARRRLKK